MIERATSAANIASMLQTMRSLQVEANGPASGLAPVTAPGVQAGGTVRPNQVGFGQMVKGALGQVNSAQLESTRLQAAYERGEGLPLTDVVLGMQKSSLAFEATLQIRNKVLKAYEDILNMPV
jgi:flagellar hook-basal body complex protein FliE